jgi:hypothetical protein
MGCFDNVDIFAGGVHNLRPQNRLRELTWESRDS